MPTYELALLIRALPKDKLTEALKKTAGYIYQEGGIIRKINNLGLQPTPFKMSSHGQLHKQANYFVYELDLPTSSVKRVTDEMAKDEYIVRNRVYVPVTPINSSECQLEDEMQIAPFRKDVQNMLKIAKATREERMKRRVKPKHGLDFDPFPL